MENYTLNVGSGERTYKEYPEGSGFKCINYDQRDLNGHTDIVGDVKHIDKFYDGYFSYILASDIIEHFPISETVAILEEWKRVLKIGGTIELRLPDLYAICKAYIDGRQDAKLTSWLIMGGQDYPGNNHFVIFDRAWLSSILKSIGFEVTSVMNSGNNFELKARRIR